MNRIGLFGKSLTAAADEKRDARRAGAAMPADTISDLRVILVMLSPCLGPQFVLPKAMI